MCTLRIHLQVRWSPTSTYFNNRQFGGYDLFIFIFFAWRNVLWWRSRSQLSYPVHQQFSRLNEAVRVVWLLSRLRAKCCLSRKREAVGQCGVTFANGVRWRQGRAVWLWAGLCYTTTLVLRLHQTSCVFVRLTELELCFCFVSLPKHQVAFHCQFHWCVTTPLAVGSLPPPPPPPVSSLCYS